MIRKDILAAIPLSTGALAGAIATVPMTLFMLGMHQLLPKWQRYALPPEQITDELAGKADVNMNKTQRLGAAFTSHFGYGSSMGSLYGAVAKRIPIPPVLKGTAFGLLVWAASYLGWLPAMEMSEAAPKEPAQRNALMIAAHVIWGATLGVVTDRLEG